MVDQMLDGKNVAVDFLAHLHLIAAVDKDCGALRQHDGDAGRAGEAGQPGQPLVARRNVFVLKAVGPRHDEAVQSAHRKFGAQGGNTRRDSAAVLGIVERLELGFEHQRNLGGEARAGNESASLQGNVGERRCRRAKTSVVQPSISRRRPSASGR
jgi:hypothetical protein